MSFKLRCSRSLLALAVGMGLVSGTALAQDQAAKIQLPQQVLQTGEEDAAAPAAAERSVAARAAAPTREQLVEQLLDATSESSEGLKTELRGDGSKAVDLEGRFMSVVIATPAKDGGYVLSCDSGESAVEHARHAHDMQIGKAPKVLSRKQQPVLEEK